MALAENSGLNALKSLTNAKGEQADRNEPFFGIDCMSTGNSNMKEQKVFETPTGHTGGQDDPQNRRRHRARVQLMCTPQIYYLLGCGRVARVRECSATGVFNNLY
jgi:hypothetical protein